MRPIATQQSALRCPLNRTLGLEANVRVLRVLCSKGHQLSRASVAKEAGLSHVGTRKSLDTLIETGFVEPVGSDHRPQYRLREAHPLSTAIRALFDAERQRAPTLWSRLRHLIATMDSPPISAWIAGAVATGSDAPNEQIRLHVLATSRDLARVRRRIAQGIGRIERELDVPIEVVAKSRPELATLPLEELENAILLFGPPPTSLHPKRDLNGDASAHGTHAEADARLRRIAKEVAKLIREDPRLVERAKRALRTQLAHADRPASDLREWLRILENNSPPQIARLLESQSDRSARLRQSPVFLPVLSPSQRHRVERAAAGESRGTKKP